MKTPFRELKLKSRQTLLGNYGITTGAIFIMAGIFFLLTIIMQIMLFVGGGISIIATEGFSNSGPLTNIYITVSLFVVYIFMIVMTYMLTPGMIRLYLNLAKKEECHASDIFFAFRHHIGKFAGVSLALSLGLLILMVPYIVLFWASMVSNDYYIILALVYQLLLCVVILYCSLVYGFFYFILAENPEKGILEALKESRNLTKGNRGRLFLLGLSFLGWLIFCYFTYFIGFIWLLPYIGVTTVFFYLDRKQKAEPVEEIPPEWTQQVENIGEDSRF